MILARPESIPESESESESTPWVRVGVGVAQKIIDPAALASTDSHAEAGCRRKKTDRVVQTDVLRWDVSVPTAHRLCVCLSVTDAGFT